MNDLFGTEPDRHHAGGKATFPMLPGVIGHAHFVGARSEHRLWLWRGDAAAELAARHYGLVIGMNPSTARHDLDDLTVRKDQVFMRGVGLSRMYKVNVGSYCSTDPAGLAPEGVAVNHPENHPTIRRLAAAASLILVATGHVPPQLVDLARQLFRDLIDDGRRLHCLGLTASGWPKHTSRLAYSTPMQDFTP